MRPITDHILTTSSSSINDFTIVNNAKFSTLFDLAFSSRSNDELIKHFPILTWCRDDQLRLIDMDLTFRKTWNDYTRIKQRNLSDLSNSTLMSKSPLLSSSLNVSQSRQHSRRNSTNKVIMDIVDDETPDFGDSDLDDNTFSDMISSRINHLELPENGIEHDVSIV